MELLYKPERDHGNADGMTRLHDMGELPCGVCRFCVRMQDKWWKFKEDDVVPLVVREISLGPGG